MKRLVKPRTQDEEKNKQESQQEWLPTAENLSKHTIIYTLLLSVHFILVGAGEKAPTQHKEV